MTRKFYHSRPLDKKAAGLMNLFFICLKNSNRLTTGLPIKTEATKNQI